MPDDTSLLSPQMPAINDSAKYRSKTMAVFIIRADTISMGFFMKTVEDGTAPGYQSVIDYVHYQQIPGSFTGDVLYFGFDRQYINGFAWDNSVIDETVTFGPISSSPPPQNNNIQNKLNPDEYTVTVGCNEVITSYYYDYIANGVVIKRDFLYSVTVITCTYSVGGSSSSSATTTTSGGGVSNGNVPATPPCTPTTPSVQSIKGRLVVDVESGGGGSGGSGGGGGSSNPCPTSKTIINLDPCAQAAALSKTAATQKEKNEDKQILQKSSTDEYGASRNLTSLTGTAYTYTPISTDGFTDNYTPPFTWDSINGYTVGSTHGHPNDSPPSYFDVYILASYLNNSLLTSAGASAIAIFEANASNVVTTSSGNYIITVNDWGALQTDYNSYKSTDAITYLNNYTNLANSYFNIDPDATPIDAGEYALLTTFGNAITLYATDPPNSTTYKPVVFNSSGNPSFLNCP